MVGEPITRGASGPVRSCRNIAVEAWVDFEKRVLGRERKKGDGWVAAYGKRMGRARLPKPNCNSADARDGILLPVVVDYTRLRFRM